MQYSGLIFRPAIDKEINKIWDLLHAESIPWNESKINKHLPQLYVLLENEKILGILFGSHSDKQIIRWVAIHPFYPEKSLKDLMIEGFYSLTMINEIKKFNLPCYSSL